MVGRSGQYCFSFLKLFCLGPDEVLILKKEIRGLVPAFGVQRPLVVPDSVFSPPTGRAVREPDRAVCPVQGRAADGRCPHDGGRALFLPHVCLLGWTEHWRYII